MTVTIICYNNLNDRCRYFATEELLLFCAAVALMAAALAIWGHWQHSRVGPASWCWAWRVEWAHLKLPMFAGSRCWSLKVLYQMHGQGAPLTLLLVSAVWARFTMIQRLVRKALAFGTESTANQHNMVGSLILTLSWLVGTEAVWALKHTTDSHPSLPDRMMAKWFISLDRLKPTINAFVRARLKEGKYLKEF